MIVGAQIGPGGWRLAAAIEAGRDDTVPDDLHDKLRRAWDWISGNY